MNQFSEKTYINKIAIIGHASISAVLVLAYAAELAKKARTLGYYLFFVLLCLLPVIIEYILYHRKKENPSIPIVMCVGYSIMYLFALFTTHSTFAYTYMFPLFMVIILYMDMRMCLGIFLVTLLGNIGFVAYRAITVGYEASQIADVEIQIASILLTGIFMIVAGKAVQKVNRVKLSQIQEQSEASAALSENIIQTARQMSQEISDVSTQILEMGTSMNQMHDSMEQVTHGSTENAESVQNQLLKTEQIQKYIDTVKDAAQQIESNMEGTAQDVSDGRKRIDILSNQIDKSMEANQQMITQMDALSQYAGQMNTIIETITSIANSTGMLALNASIEAARAGEAGRGFAVVASQISTLASQTKSATVNITELINHINTELESARSAVNIVADSNHQNRESTQAVSGNFNHIMEGTDTVVAQAQELMGIVDDLFSANREITENIQTISAITEEVSAHANETYHACEQNSILVNHVSSIVSSLNENTAKLQNTK